jgi:hypothetical protein
VSRSNLAVDDQLVIGLPRLQRLFAGEGQQMLGESAPRDSFVDHPGDDGELESFSTASPEFRWFSDDCQDIVEVMGNAAGERNGAILSLPIRSSAAILSVRSRMAPLNTNPSRRFNAVTLSSTLISRPSRRRASISMRRPRIRFAGAQEARCPTRGRHGGFPE